MPQAAKRQQNAAHGASRGANAANDKAAKGRKKSAVDRSIESSRGLNPQVIFLVGFMGAGKSSVGRTLARHLGWRFEDLDDLIETREGKKVADIFRDSGEDAFRRAESAALSHLLRQAPEGKVVALGGGTFAQPRNHEAIQAAGVRTVFLSAPLTELWRRCETQAGPGASRPLQQSKNAFRETYRSRLRFYRTAWLTVDTAGKQIEAVAAEIAAALRPGDQQ